MREIQRAIAEHFGCTLDDLLGRSRKRRNAQPRMAAMWLCQRVTRRSLPQIAAVFRRDHTTVLSGCRRIDALMAADPEFDAEMRALLIALLPASGPPS